MKCHNCGNKMSRSELRKHSCENKFQSLGMSEKERAYLKKFGSSPSLFGISPRTKRLSRTVRLNT